jgi:iron(III) transport system permease protein
MSPSSTQTIAISRTDWSKIAIFAVASAAACAILGLLLIVIWMSLREGVPGQLSAYSLKNYYALLTDPYHYKVMWNTLGIALTAVLVSASLGFMFAWLIERTDLPYKSLAVALLSMGVLIPTFLKAMGWIFLLHPRIGMINLWLKQLFGLQNSPLNIASLTGIGFVEGITVTPVAFAMISSALRSMNPALVEAASIHGVGRLRTLLRIELPLVWPALVSVVIWIFTIAIAAFDVPAVIGMANNIFTFSTALYFTVNPTEGLPKYGISGAFGTVMIVFSLVLMLPYFYALKHSHRYQVISGKAYRTRPVELGRWAVAGWALLGLYNLLAFVFPLLAMIWTSLLPYTQLPSWQAFANISFHRYGELAVDRSVIQSALNTLFLMAAVPTLVVILSSAISWVVTRTRMRGRFILDAVAFLPHPVPNILFALSIAYLALLISNVVPLYGTIYVLLAVYVICWISFGTRLLNGNMLQVHRELEEAAQVGGVRALRVLGKIIMPLVRPGLVYAWVWTALMAYRELTMAVLLASPKNPVLSTFIWSQWNGGGLGDAGAAGVMMVGVMSPLVMTLWIFARKQQQIIHSNS